MEANINYTKRKSMYLHISYMILCFSAKYKSSQSSTGSYRNQCFSLPRKTMCVIRSSVYK